MRIVKTHETQLYGLDVFSRLSALASLYNFSQSRKEKIETGVILHCLTRARGCSYTTVIPPFAGTAG